MSYSSSIHASTGVDLRDREGARRAVLPSALGVLAAGSALTVYGAHDLREIAIVVSVLVAVVAGVYGFVLPRGLRRGGSGTALVLSVTGALLLLPAFWSALPLAFGVAGALLGYGGRRGTQGSSAATAAVAIGALAAIGYFVIYALDALSQAGVTWA